MNAELGDYRWLVSDAARSWLDRAREELSSARGPSASLLNRLRKDLSAARAHLVVEQTELRERAREKFSLADQMFFTRKGLEQATDEQVAASKSSRFPTGEAAADLCCGIGGDALAVARRGPVVAVDQDDACVLLALANARACDVPEARFRGEAADAATYPVDAVSAWHIDPDRRPQGRRTSQVELFQPPLAAIEALLARNRNAAIKLAPAADAPDAWRDSAELQWLGSRGECRQQVAWFGSLARHPGRRSATVVDAAGGPRTIVGTGDEPIPLASSLGRYLYEPHNSVLAAKLTGALCREHALAAVSPGIAYLTSESHVNDPVLAAFEVRDVLPFDQKQLKAWCRERQVGQLEVKKRGVDLDPDRLRRAIVGKGDGQATMIVTRLLGKVMAVVASRVDRRGDC